MLEFFSAWNVGFGSPPSDFGNSFQPRRVSGPFGDVPGKTYSRFIRTPPPPCCWPEAGGIDEWGRHICCIFNKRLPPSRRPSDVARRRGGPCSRRVGSAHCAGGGGARAPPQTSTPSHHTPHPVASLISDYDGSVFNSGRTISQPRGRRIIVFSE